jgi:hypothetical protein
MVTLLELIFLVSLVTACASQSAAGFISFGIFFPFSKRLQGLDFGIRQTDVAYRRAASRGGM